MKRIIVVLSFVLGASLLLTVLAVAVAPDLLESPGGIAALFGAIFVAIMAIGGGTIKGWVETLFGEKEKKREATTSVTGGVYIAHADKVDLNTSPKDNSSDEKQDEVEEAPLSKEEARTAYLSALIDDFRPLSLAGMDTHSGDLKAKLPLEDIYISLDTTTQVDVEQKGGRRGKVQTPNEDAPEFLRQEPAKPLSALGALTQVPARRMVLLGAPGTGKSTFVRYLSLRMARMLRDASGTLENWNGKTVLPVAVSLGRFSESLPPDTKTGSAEMVEKYLVSSLSNDPRTRQFAPHILSTLRETGGLVLFDGLDEVANLDLRPVVVKAVESFAEKYSINPHSRFLVTCRIYSYQDERWKLTGWPQFELALFSPEQIRRFITLWYDLHTGLESGRSGEFRAKKGKLLAAVQADDPRRLYEVARYPLILTMMAIIHANHELPDSRARVYEQCVELLLDKWQHRRSIRNREEIRSLSEELELPASAIYEPLYEIAFKAHKGYEGGKDRNDQSGSLITEGLIYGVLHDTLQDKKKIETFMDYCRNANGLLMLRGTVTLAGSNVKRNDYAFPHLTFEEFLASRFMKDLDSEEVRTLLDDSHDRWREAVKFMGELYCFSKEPNRNAMNGLLEALSSPFPASPAETDWRALWLAGELLTYYNRIWKEKRKSPYEDDIVKNLRRLVFESPLSPRERADAADIVDQLAPVDDLYDFISLPNFAVSKYPVTNAQYERFLKAENFQNKSLWVDFPKFDEKCAPMTETWGEEAWNWLQKELQDDDNETQDGVLLPRYWRDPRFGVNRRHAPVVGISWYETNAYCKWLLQNWEDLEEGKQGMQKPAWIRLPLETEWARAAGGEENDRFAFGELKDPKKEIPAYANTSESNINRTTPVWMYPQGISPTKAMDMSGNVWEWQANYRDNDHDFLVLRGGSWYGLQDLARVSLRNPPSYWDDSLGFRVVAVSLPNG